MGNWQLPLAVLAAFRRALHETRRWTALISVAGRFLHGAEGEDRGVDVILGTGALEVLVVLLARLSDAAVVLIQADMGELVDVEERRIPTVAFQTAVKPCL